MDREKANNLIGEAADWLARLDSGSATLDELEQWRAADPRRAAAFAQVAHSWMQLDRLRRATERPQPPVVSPDPVPAADLRAPPARAMPRRAMLRAAALGAVVAAGASLLAPRLFFRSSARTRVGERRLLSLPDGSRADLNTDTAVSWHFTDTARLFWLEQGEVALTVAADPARPFMLDAGDGQARLDPGVFNARRRDAALDLTVVSGTVVVPPRPKQPTETVIAGQRNLFLTAEAAVDRPLTAVELQAASAWQRDEIIFDGTPLVMAVEEYNRYLQRKLVISDPRLGQLRLGGRFTTRDPQAFLAALAESFRIRAVNAGQDSVVLTRGS